MARDDFTIAVKDALAKRANYLCSRSDCRVRTVGPHSEPSKTVNIGTAAHITAASPKGPRYDPTLTPLERKSIENAIWLCATHGREVDTDVSRFTSRQLRGWKIEAEREAAQSLGRPAPSHAEREAVEVAKARLRYERIEKLAKSYKTIGAPGLRLEISSFTDLSQEEKAEMFDTASARNRAGRLPKQNPFRCQG